MTVQVSKWVKTGLLAASMAMAFSFAFTSNAHAAQNQAAGKSSNWEKKASETFFLAPGMADKLMTRQEYKSELSKMKKMNPDQRMAFRKEMHKEYMQEARDRGMNLPSVPPNHGKANMQGNAMNDEQGNVGQSLLLLVAGGGAGGGAGAGVGGGAAGATGGFGAGTGTGMGSTGMGNSGFGTGTDNGFGTGTDNFGTGTGNNGFSAPNSSGFGTGSGSANLNGGAGTGDLDNDTGNFNGAWNGMDVDRGQGFSGAWNGQDFGDQEGNSGSFDTDQGTGNSSSGDFDTGRNSFDSDMDRGTSNFGNQGSFGTQQTPGLDMDRSFQTDRNLSTGRSMNPSLVFQLQQDQDKGYSDSQSYGSGSPDSMDQNSDSSDSMNRDSNRDMDKGGLSGIGPNNSSIDPTFRSHKDSNLNKSTDQSNAPDHNQRVILFTKHKVILILAADEAGGKGGDTGSFSGGYGNDTDRGANNFRSYGEDMNNGSGVDRGSDNDTNVQPFGGMDKGDFGSGDMGFRALA